MKLPSNPPSTPELEAARAIVAEARKKVQPQLDKVLAAAAKSGAERRRNRAMITDPALRRSAARA